jgi:hypothetical protein
VSLIFLLSIISGAMSTESFLNSRRVIIRGEQGFFFSGIQNRLSRQGRSWKRKGPAMPGLFSGSLQ